MPRNRSRFPEGTLRAGIIGLTTSHVAAFTGAINDPKAEGAMADVMVTAGYPGGMADNPSSIDRVEGFTEKLRDQGVTIYETIEEMLPSRRRDSA